MASSLCVAGRGLPAGLSLRPGTAPRSRTHTRRSSPHSLRTLSRCPQAVLDAGHVAQLAEASLSGVSSLGPALHAALPAVGDAGSQLLHLSSSLHGANSVALLAELSPEDAGLLATILGPALAAVNLLFIFRIVMSWYPQVRTWHLAFAVVHHGPLGS